MLCYAIGRKYPALKRLTRAASASQRCPPLRGLGKNALGGSGWLDLASLVSGGGQIKSVYADLAYKIGKLQLNVATGSSVEPGLRQTKRIG